MHYFLFIIFAQAMGVLAEWVDPHDMDLKHRKVEPIPNNSVSEKYKVTKVSSESDYSEDKIVFHYLKRVISLLLSSTEEEDPNVLRGRYLFHKEKDDYKFLVEFISSEKIDLQKLRQLDNVLSAVFSKSFSEVVVDILITTNEKLLSFLNTNILFIFAVIVALYILYHLKNQNFSFVYVLKYFLFVVVIIDYAHRYQVLLEVCKYFMTLMLI